MASFNNIKYISYFIIYLIIWIIYLETKVIVDIENKYQFEEIRTLAKFEFSVKNIILELFKEGPGEVMYNYYLIL